MKRHLVLVLTLCAALMVVLWLTTTVGADWLAGPAAPQAGAPPVVSYQGQVIVAGAAYSGTGYFKFAVVNAAGDTTYWLNDGTATGGVEPINAVSLTVRSGLFNVLLGDVTLPNMTALPASAFGETDRALRVWFSSDGATFTLLTPDRRIAAVPYALQAEEAKDADLLDGQHAAAFAISGHDHWGASWNGTGAGLTLSGGSTGLSASGSSYGVLGQTDGASGYKAGVRGETTSTGGWGIHGYASASSGTTYGVGGVADSTVGTGVYGSASASTGTTYGVYGTATSPAGTGVFGAGATGVYGLGNLGSGWGVFGVSGMPGGAGVCGYTTSPSGWAGKFTAITGDGVYITAQSGRVGLNVAGGSKNAVVATADGSRLLYTEESTEVWFSDYGFGQLEAGQAIVSIDPIFAQTVNLGEPYHVYLTAQGEEFVLLLVAAKGQTSFTVRGVTLDGQPAHAAFDYRIAAKRLGYEQDRLERAPWADDDPNLYPEKLAAWQKLNAMPSQPGDGGQ